MSAIEQQLSIRKSLLATTAVAVVLNFSEPSDINWAIKLDGAHAWLFLLLAHSYFTVMWALFRKTRLNEGSVIYSGETNVDYGPRKIFGVFDRVKMMTWMKNVFTDIIAVIGFGFMLYNVATLPEPTATEATDAPCAAHTQAPYDADIRKSYCLLRRHLSGSTLVGI